MASDKLFQRRKAKKAKELARKKARRERYAKVLIVCEGKKTEPNYFNDLKDRLELNSANVVVTGECGSSPVSIADFAFQQYHSERDTGDPFDKVYCVFDKDQHGNSYAQALDRINSATPKSTFVSITSVPCFEYWLLLHFIYTTAPYNQAGSKSGCESLITELRKYLAGYQKGDNTVFEKILGQLPQAKVYADRALKAAQASDTDNPSTKVHELVEYLENIKND
jgi:hypothetical protein